MEQNKFKRYDSPEQYAEAFQQMIDAREKWREQVREQEAQDILNLRSPYKLSRLTIMLAFLCVTIIRCTI